MRRGRRSDEDAEQPRPTAEEFVARLRAGGIGLEPAGDHRWIVRDHRHPGEPVVLLPEPEFQEWVGDDPGLAYVNLDSELGCDDGDGHNRTTSLRLRRGPDGRIRLESDRLAR